MGRALKLSVTLALLIAAALAFAACGRGSQPGRLVNQPQGLVNQPDGLVNLQAADSPQSIDDALTELDALACPEGVDAELWRELKGALEEALCRAGICAPPSSEDSRAEARRTGIEDGHSMLCPYRSVATPPTGDINRVDDLAIADNGDGTYTLTWHYRNLGDYGQDGRVALEDIYPLAEHFGEIVPEDDTGRNSLQAVIDGSGNGKVDIADITPIARHYQTTVQRYVIEGAESIEGPWGPVSEVAQETGGGEGRLEYGSIIQSPAALWHRVVAYDSEGNPGEPSNAVLRPSNEPVIYEVTPTEGYQHEECTFSATVTGVEPLSYAWDFGSGAEPNTSSDVSPTVILADAGEYEANLTVTNAYGSSNHLFSLAVNERDQWVHTWGGIYGRASGVRVDSASFYVAGSGNSDALLMKCSPDGSLLWAREWGGEELDFNSDYLADMVFAADGSIVAAGGTQTFGEGKDDLVLLRYSPSGELLRAMTWGTSDYEQCGRSTGVDSEGNLYLCGDWVVYGGEPLALVVKFASDWSVLWAKLWGGTSWDCAVGIAVANGALYLCGNTESFGAPEGDAFILKVSYDGEVLWARTWGTDSSDVFYSLAVGDDGSVYAVGNSSGSGGLLTSIMAKYSPDGSLEVVKGWNAGVRSTLTCVSLNASGNVVAGGRDGEAGLIALELDKDLVFIRGEAWLSEEHAGGHSGTPNSIACDAEGYLYVAGYGLTPTGSWSELPDLTFTCEGSVQEVEGTVWDIEGVTNEPEGTQTSPDMVMDVESGSSYDPLVLLIKNYPK